MITISLTPTASYHTPQAHISLLSSQTYRATHPTNRQGTLLLYIQLLDPTTNEPEHTIHTALNHLFNNEKELKHHLKLEQIQFPDSIDTPISPGNYISSTTWEGKATDDDTEAPLEFPLGYHEWATSRGV